MKTGTYLFSSSYFPPVHYISLLSKAEEAIIEREENYTKQTYRNRCMILSANGPLALTVPVLSGSFHKTPVKELKIDYSKRWQQVHTRGLISSYSAAPYFEYYFGEIEKIISVRYEYLIDLNQETLRKIADITGISTPFRFSSVFTRPGESEGFDYRNLISPKKDTRSIFQGSREYRQVFSDRFGFTAGLSSLDLIFNTGPDAYRYL
jgi:hypothetical protein